MPLVEIEDALRHDGQVGRSVAAAINERSGDRTVTVAFSTSTCSPQEGPGLRARVELNDDEVAIILYSTADTEAASVCAGSAVEGALEIALPEPVDDRSLRVTIEQPPKG